MPEPDEPETHKEKCPYREWFYSNAHWQSQYDPLVPVARVVTMLAYCNCTDPNKGEQEPPPSAPVP